MFHRRASAEGRLLGTSKCWNDGFLLGTKEGCADGSLLGVAGGILEMLGTEDGSFEGNDEGTLIGNLKGILRKDTMCWESRKVDWTSSQKALQKVH
jgi:hypothetical protein